MCIFNILIQNMLTHCIKFGSHELLMGNYFGPFGFNQFSHNFEHLKYKIQKVHKIKMSAN